MWFSRSPSFPSITSTIRWWLLAFLIRFVNVIFHNDSNWCPQHKISRYSNKNAIIGIVTYNTFISSIGISAISLSAFSGVLSAIESSSTQWVDHGVHRRFLGVWLAEGMTSQAWTRVYRASRQGGASPPLHSYPGASRQGGSADASVRSAMLLAWLKWNLMIW